MTLICYLTRVAENILTTRIEFQQKFLSMLSCQKAVVLIFLFSIPYKKLAVLIGLELRRLGLLSSLLLPSHCQSDIDKVTQMTERIIRSS